MPTYLCMILAHVQLERTWDETGWHSTQYSLLTNSKDNNVFHNCAEHMCTSLCSMTFLVRPDLLQEHNEQGDG